MSLFSSAIAFANLCDASASLAFRAASRIAAASTTSKSLVIVLLSVEMSERTFAISACVAGCLLIVSSCVSCATFVLVGSVIGCCCCGLQFLREQFVYVTVDG